MAEENISQEFRLKIIGETKNYLIEEINQNEYMSKKHKNVCTTLNYLEHFLILASRITGWVSISGFAPLAGIPIGIMSSTIGLKICVITAGIIRYKSIINKKKKKHDKIVLLAKYKLNSIEVLTSEALIDSVISHYEFVLTNNVLKEYNEMKEEIKNLKKLIYNTMLSYCLKCRKNTESKNQKSFKDEKRKNNSFIKMCGV